MLHYEFPFRTRGYETDTTFTVPPAVYLRYLEHTRWEWLLEPRMGFVDHLHSGHFFVVLRQTLALKRRIGMGIDCTVVGRIEKVGRSTVDLEHRILRDSDGALVARAWVTGAWLGPSRRLARVPDHLREAARQAEPLPALAHEPPHVPDVPDASTLSRIAPPEHVLPSLCIHEQAPKAAPFDDLPLGAFVHRRVVLPSELDTFDHVNAATYVGFMDDARRLAGLADPAHFDDAAAHPLARVALAYDREALGGETVDTAVWPLQASATPAAGEHGTHPPARSFGAVVYRDGVALCRARLDTV